MNQVNVRTNERRINQRRHAIMWVPVKTKGRATYGEDGGRLKAWQPNPAHMIASREPFLIHLNLLSHPVMQRPMCSPVTDLPQTEQTERERCSTGNGKTYKKPRHTTSLITRRR